jgi:hypothetical protein
VTAEHESADGVAYDGMDALMAAITGEPLPPDARRDPLRRAEHRAAEADVTALKNQLTWLAEALTGETQVPGAEGGTRVPGAEGGTRVPRSGRGAREPGDVEEAPASEAGMADGGAEAPGGGVGPRGAPRPGKRRGAARPGDGARLAGSSRPRPPGRPSGSRRAARVALGSFAGSAAFCLALGFGWLVTHSPGDVASGGKADDAGAKSAADAPAEASGDGGRPSDPVRDLACSRLVVEGTVVAVEPGAEPHSPSSPHSPSPPHSPSSARTPSSWSRITLSVIRSYKPAHGPAEVSFLLAGGAEPAPRKGQHVLVQVGAGRPNATRWTVGDARVAAVRARISEALPASGHTSCPSGGTP